MKHSVFSRMFEGHQLFCDDGVNNSTLSNIKKILCGESLFFGNEKFLAVGRELHQRVLQPEIDWTHMGEDEDTVWAMQCALYNHSQFMDHLNQSITEELRHGFVNNVYMRGTLDMQGFTGKWKRKGGDIKTTACPDLISFYQKAIEYGYPRQGYIYCQLAGLTDFIFYGVQKKWPYKVLVMDLKDFSDEVKEAKKELDYLLYMYQKYILDRHEGAKTILAKAIQKNKT